MKKLFIHIGPHKTGSTYIQKNLFAQSDSLRKHGVLYPESLIGPQWGHHKLVEKIKQRNADKIAEFFEIDEERVLLSRENFEALTKDDISFLSKFTEKFTIEVIFFKRAYSKLLVSAWQESVKQGESKTWSEFFLNHALKPFQSKILNSSSVLDNWSMLSKHIHVFDYDAMLSEGLDIAKTMCSKVLNIELAVEAAAVNRSMNLADIEIIRMLNHRYYERTGQHPRTRVRDAYLKLKSEKDDSIAEAFSVVKNGLSEETLDESWTINFFENKFVYKNDMYFAKTSDSRKTYRLPNSNSVLTENFISTLIAIEDKMPLNALL